MGFTWSVQDAKNKNVEHVLILSGDHLYRMNYMEFVQKHIDTNADVTVSCVPMDDRTDVLLKLLRWSYPSCNDFGSEIIPSAVKDHNVQHPPA
ncbi:GLUCOSE-1-PHOSPHATE ADENYLYLTRANSFERASE-RELATED [Salix koriyanagi]|uniref:glucose-1-phosphate adenylyltransferase n=1 Tax=Salix koriyanagi TaxID=2511006 RepID=A0A9Q0WA78_9ROSI|nr:GLUCOSE-1-PHOSPHATE ADENYLYLTRANSFERASE-RELATED [Salix koriyanagi]